MAQIAEENATEPHTVTFDEGLPAGEKLVELWLSNVGGVAISALQIEGGRHLLHRTGRVTGAIIS